MLSILATLVVARPLLLAHFMPWHQSKSFSGQWGWHWTMNHYDPDAKGSDGRQQLASKFRPLIGAYDASDPDAIECQVLQMKLAGMDGVLIDWYGTTDLYDYLQINRNTQLTIDACEKAGLKFGIVLEDQVVNPLVKAGKATPESFVHSAIQFLQADWFKRTGYVQWQGKPMLLIFGPQFYKDPDLEKYFDRSIALFTLLGTRGPAVGAFGWPEPQVGDEKSWKQIDAYLERAKQWQASMPVAYPRFEDTYKEAGVGPGYGEIKDQDGFTFKHTLDLALNAKAPFVQICTWNDWGEGTQIEPSVEFGYRDLEVLQAARRKLDSSFASLPADLRLPEKVYRLRKRHVDRTKLDQATDLLRAGHPSEAKALLDAL